MPSTYAHYRFGRDVLAKVPQSNVFGEMLEILREIGTKKKILLFLTAYFFYIDGVYTIIDMATAYGSALGLNTVGLLLAQLLTQIVAFQAR